MGNEASRTTGAEEGDHVKGDATPGEEKKEDHHPGSRRKHKSRKGDKMASGKDIWNSNAGSQAQRAEEQVHVNLPMADLMAYLQVVANNSNHLPWTKRDDPDMDRSVNDLSSEDYARKSAAFVPADVRVLGGVFTRYGRVWDLPNSMEYNAVDGAHEPGRSYGGACANALLKVVYDAASDVMDAAQSDAAAASLFDDDDEDEDNMSLTKSGFALDCAQPNPTTITWADLLRKMKAEMKEIEYAQYPKITTTRKIDLNKAFSLVPEDFNPQTGKKRSLLIGCNYKNDKDALLKASHDDVRSMKDYIVNVHGFPESSDLMTVLLDDKEHPHPTFKNITEAFKALSEQSQPGDAVFVQFSGHGSRVLDTDIEEATYDEVIVPSDYQQAGLIRDTLIFKTLLAPMRYGVTVTIVMDCCDNGILLELPYGWSTKSDRQQHQLAKLSVNDEFSFVRFLKVVKTLYDSSTFTQLGKTVGLALNEEDDTDLPEDDTRSANDQASEMEIAQDKSLYDMFTEACKLSQKKRRGGKDLSVMDKVINSCAILAVGPDENYEGELTDEDTLRTDTGGFSYDDGSTAVSYTDDESVERRRHRSRRK